MRDYNNQPDPVTTLDNDHRKDSSLRSQPLAHVTPAGRLEVDGERLFRNRRVQRQIEELKRLAFTEKK